MAPYVKLVPTLLAGLAGGTIFAWLGLPAPWLTGAMVTVAAAAAVRLPVAEPEAARHADFVMVGTSIGSAVPPDGLARLRAWPGSILVLALSICATMAASAAYLTLARS